MSTNSWECGVDPLSEWLVADEWLLLRDDQEGEFNNTSLKLTRSKIAEQTLNEIEDFVKKENDFWLEEIPLYEEIQSILPSEDTRTEPVLQNLSQKLNQEQFSSNRKLVTPDIFEQSTDIQKILGSVCENSNFFITDENLLFADNESFLDIATLQSGCLKSPQNHINFKFLDELKDKESKSYDVESGDQTVGLENDVDIKRESEIVDELIRNVSLDNWELDGSSSETSLDTSNSSPSSTPEIESDDPEWRPSFIKSSKGGRNVYKKSKSTWGERSQEDKKLRKKEQNKNAAIRYRQKKKAEIYEVLQEEEQLKRKKAKLEEKVTEIQNEIKCLKGLMRDLYKVKGIIN